MVKSVANFFNGICHKPRRTLPFMFFFFFNDTATTEIYTLSLHDALPISPSRTPRQPSTVEHPSPATRPPVLLATVRSEEHTSELQSHSDIVCRLLLEKKNSMLVDDVGLRHPSHVAKALATRAVDLSVQLR